MSDKPLCIIAARGGSKRLPRKNLLPICGKPMLTYPIKAAFESGLFEQVIVSTEDREIAIIATEAGTRVINRPDEIATDSATVVDVCLHVLEILKTENAPPDIFCSIYPTAIFLTPEDLEKSYRLLTKEPQCDFVMGVSEYNLHPVQALVESNGFLQPMWPEYRGLKSQFYPRLLSSNGTLYWAKVPAFQKTKSFYGDRLKGYEIARSRGLNIDTPEDYEIAKVFASKLLGDNRDQED